MAISLMNYNTLASVSTQYLHTGKRPSSTNTCNVIYPCDSRASSLTLRRAVLARAACAERCVLWWHRGRGWAAPPGQPPSTRQRSASAPLPGRSLDQACPPRTPDTSEK